MSFPTVKIVPGSRPDVAIVHLEGPVIAEGVPNLQTQLRTITAALTVLEMSQTPHMDSLGMGALLNFLSAQQKNGRRVCIADPSKRVMMLIELTKVNTVLPVFNTVAEAENS